MRKTCNRRKGSALITIFIISAALAGVLASVISRTMGEMRLNASNRLNNESRQGAEVILEYGIAQLARSFNQSASLFEDAFNPFNPVASPMVLSSDLLQFLRSGVGTSKLLLPEQFDPEKLFEYDSTLIAGLVSESFTWEISDRVPGHETNSMAGTTMRVHTVDIYSKATARDPRWGDRTTYLKQTFRVVDQSLYQYAVFYSPGDLELAPGPLFNLGEMGVPGPVHSNHNIYLGTNNTLNVNVRMTTAGDFFARRHPDSGQGSQSGTINLLRADTGELINLRVAGTYLESIYTPHFRELASERFRGGLMTREHGVQQRFPVGIEELGRLFRNPEAPANENNWEYHLIKPPANILAIVDDDSLTIEQRTVLQTVEEMKFAVRAGLTVKLSEDLSTVRLFTHEFDENGRLLYDSAGNPRQIELALDDIDPFWDVQPFSATHHSNNATVNSGIFDYRMAEGSEANVSGEISLLRIDIGSLRTALEEPSLQANWRRIDGDNLASRPAHLPKKWWNGGIFVQMPQTSDPDRADRVVPARADWAVQLHNGRILPNPTQTDHFSDSPHREVIGLTLATNSALYIQGDFNAPTNKGTSTTPHADDQFGALGGEVPASLIADAITVLSNSWNNQDSRKFTSGSVRRATNTMISAAFVTGNVATARFGGSTQYSGGVENFPRFLEDWSSRTLTYRGSMVMLFRSEVQNKRWGFNNVYSAPNRSWGFHRRFSEGFRPPLDIGPRTFHRVGFTELTSARFNAEIAELRQRYMGESEEE